MTKMASILQGPSPKLPFKWEKAEAAHILKPVTLTHSGVQNQVSGRLRLGEGSIFWEEEEIIHSPHV